MNQHTRTGWITRILFVLIFFTYTANAGVSGSIEGKIVDAADGRTLPGVNILLVGTTIGAVSDANGQYRFPNVRAGYYEMRFSAIGYNTVIIKGVRVQIDLRTRVDARMEASAVELAPIEITAETPLIQKDLASAAYSISSGKFSALPVSTFEEVLTLQPGTTFDGHVRGGKTNEVFYLVDGLPVQDVFSGTAGTLLPKSSIGTMTMYIGGFSAQYGNAMSGIVNIITRGGTNMHQFFARLETDNALPSSVNKQTDLRKEFELAANGPVVTDKLFYYTANSLTLSDGRWWQEMQNFFDSPVSTEFSGVSKLDYIISPATRLSAQGIYSTRSWRDYEFSWRYNLSGLPARKRGSYRAAALFSHTLSDKSFFTASLSNFHVNSQIGEPYQIDTLRPFQYDFFYRFITKGSRFYHADQTQNILTLKGDFSTLIERLHTVSAGFQLNRHAISSQLEKYDPQFSYFGKPLEDQPMTAYYNDYAYHPSSGNAYVQDKIEFTEDGSTLDLGLRWDFLNPAVSYPVIEFSKRADGSYVPVQTGSKKASFKQQVSPRFTITLPLTPTNMIYVNFGVYYQNPLFEYLYAGLSPAQIKTGTLPVSAGNPDLEPEKTTAWEAGYKQSLDKHWVASGAYFKKTVRNQLDTKTLVPSDSKMAGDYGFASYVNSAQADISGFEAMFSREGDERFSGSVSYTFMITEGTSDYIDQSLNYVQWGFPLMAQPYPLSWDQRHTFKADVSALLPWDVRMNATASFNSARPYTYFPTRDGFTAAEPNRIFAPNNDRMEATTFVNVKLSKRFSIDASNRSSISVTLDVRNLFNAKNVQWIDSNGRIGGELGDPSAYYDPRRTRLGITAEF
ncbi:MAG TPA: TonB-dependent receptor [Bacteroidota bacterium]|nr:TonB-dependent receptor [Bacteroidota bacterium]